MKGDSIVSYYFLNICEDLQVRSKDLLAMYEINFIANSMPSQMQSTKNCRLPDNRLEWNLWGSAEYAMALQHSDWLDSSRYEINGKHTKVTLQLVHDVHVGQVVKQIMKINECSVALINAIWVICLFDKETFIRSREVRSRSQ